MKMYILKWYCNSCVANTVLTLPRGTFNPYGLYCPACGASQNYHSNNEIKIGILEEKDDCND